MSERHIYKVDDGEQWWIVAGDEEQARAFARDHDVGADWLPPHAEPEEWERKVSVERVPDDEEITIGFMDDPDAPYPAGARNETPDKSYPSWCATARQWAEDGAEGSVIGSTVY